MPWQLNIDPPSSLVTIATMKTDAAILKAYFGSNQTEMMLDSGSAVPLVRQDIAKSCSDATPTDTIGYSLRGQTDN